MLAAGRALSGTLDIRSLLKTVLGLAAQVVRAETSSLLLIDNKTGDLVFDVALGEMADKVKSVRLSPGEGLAGWVASHKIPLIVNDVQSDPRWTNRADQQSEFVTRQVVAVPVLWQGLLTGVLEAINKKGGGGFSSVDGRILEAFAAQAAVAIENARLYSRLKEEKETLSVLVAEMSDGALLVNDSGRVALANPAAKTLLGVEQPEGESLETLLRSFETVPTVRQISLARELLSVSLTRVSGKKLSLEGTLQPYGFAGGRLLLFRDVTEARQEEWLKQNFLSVISHKLKTPLVSITGFAPMLLEDRSLSGIHRQAVTAIHEQGQKLARLVDRLLMFTQVEARSVAVARRRCRGGALVRETVAALSTDLVRLNAEVQVDESIDALPALSVDSDLFAEALRNLIDNAVKFNHKPKRMVRLYARVDGPDALISVEDEGPGIAPEDHPKIFRKFYQVEESFTGQVEGVGLGLALVRRIVGAHGGAVMIRSVLGRGSVFTTRWPLDE